MYIEVAKCDLFHVRHFIPCIVRLFISLRAQVQLVHGNINLFLIIIKILQEILILKCLVLEGLILINKHTYYCRLWLFIYGVRFSNRVLNSK